MHEARDERVERVVATSRNMLSWMKSRSSLTHDDVAGQYRLTCADTLQSSVSVVSACRAPATGDREASPPYFLTPNLFPIEFLPFFDDPPPRFVDVRTCISPIVHIVFIVSLHRHIQLCSSISSICFSAFSVLTRQEMIEES